MIGRSLSLRPSAEVSRGMTCEHDDQARRAPRCRRRSTRSRPVMSCNRYSITKQQIGSLSIDLYQLFSAAKVRTV